MRAGADGQPPRPPSSQSTAPSVTPAHTSRPFSAASSQLAGAALSYQAFCAALVHVAAKLARGSPELQEACPFLSVRAPAQAGAGAGAL